MPVKSLLLQCTVLALFSFAGGFAGQLYLGKNAVAQVIDAPPETAAPRQPAKQNFFELGDRKNRKAIDLYVMDGQGGQVFYDEGANLRLQLGTYSGAGERGQPMMGLNDSKGNIRLLLRLAGKNESPVLVMKDQSGTDRLVLGLSLSGGQQEPFLSVTDASGRRRDIFGSYNGETH